MGKTNMHASSKKIALVTGANKGIGFEIARQISRTGVTVLLGARNMVAGEKPPPCSQAKASPPTLFP